jgi:hypothetical protein
MMLPPNPDVLDTLIRDRQSHLRTSAPIVPGFGTAVRVRVGHALIAAGSALSGERVDRRPARGSTLSRAA